VTIRKQIKRACAAAWGVTLATPASTAAAAPKPASKEQIEQHLRTLTTDPAVLDALRAIAHPAPAVAATVPAVQALTDAACQWGQEDEGSGTYWSACGHGFTFNDGGPTDNGLKHCCYCGKPLIELPWVEPEPDAGIPAPAAREGE